MGRLLLLLLVLVTLAAAQKLYVENFSNMKYTEGITEEKLKNFITNANKEGWAAMQKRIKNFINNNVAAAGRATSISSMEYICKNVALTKQFMNAIYAAIKKSKAIGDPKQKEIKKIFDELDKTGGHMLYWNYPDWLAATAKVIPADKWKIVNSTISKTEAAYKKNNKANYQYIFDYKPVIGK